MKKMLPIFLILSAILSTVQIQAAELATEKMPDIDLELVRNSILQEALFAEIDDALSGKSVPKLLPIFSFLKENSVLVAPFSDGVQLLEVTRPPDFIFLLFISKEEGDISEDWQENIELTEDTPVEFFPDIATILVRKDLVFNLNQTEMTIRVLQKAYEGMLFTKNGRRIPQNAEFLRNKELINTFVTQAACYLQ